MSELPRHHPDHPDYPELQRLITQIREGTNEEARAAMSKLNFEMSFRGGLLVGANLNFADLREVQLKHANLSHANLNGAILIGADIADTNLHSVDLRDAVLEDAVLKTVDLSFADLSFADLRSAQLRNSTLSNANLNGTVLTDTAFCGVDFTEVKGLDNVEHIGPSYVDFQTLVKSQGKIPDSFLRGVGFSDDYINYVMPLFRGGIQMYSVFISYSFADSEFAKRLYDRLQGAGIRCWLAEHDLTPGEIISDRIGEVIRTYDKTILVCSENSLTSWWVEDEIEKTLQEEQDFRKNTGEKILKLIPVDLDGFMLDKQRYKDGQASQIRRRLAADFTNWKDHDAFEASFEKLVKALKVHRPPKVGI